MGMFWYRQERISISKHVGATLFTPLTNNKETTINGNQRFAMAA